jgi:Flp pilus assembly protein TadD
MNYLLSGLGAGVMLMAMTIIVPPATSQNDQTSQFIRSCRGDNGIPADQSISACTSLLPYANGAQAEGGVYHFRGEAYARSGDHANAIKDFTRALQLIPDQPELTPFLYVRRGISYATLNQTSRAISDFQTAIARQSPNQDIREVAEQWLRSLGASR